MNKLSKGTKIKIVLDTNNLKSILTNFENDVVKDIKLEQEPHPYIAELTEDLLLENFEDTDNRLAYKRRNKNKTKTYISDKIKRITLTKKMVIPSEHGIEINLHDERYCIETESNTYYIEIVKQLKKGTKISMNGRSDFITLKYQIVETGEVIEMNFHDDYDEIIKGREAKEICGISNYIPFEAELVEDIPYLEDYTNTNFKFVYKVGDKNSEPEIIKECHIYDKLKLNYKVKRTIPDYVEEQRKKVDIDDILDSVKVGEKTGNITTADGLTYFFDIL